MRSIVVSTSTVFANRCRTPERPYAEITLQEVNPDQTVAARISSTFDLRAPDRADAAQMNRVLWLAIKGPGRPYPKRHPAGG